MSVSVRSILADCLSLHFTVCLLPVYLTAMQIHQVPSVFSVIHMDIENKMLLAYLHLQNHIEFKKKLYFVVLPLILEMLSIPVSVGL